MFIIVDLVLRSETEFFRAPYLVLCTTNYKVLIKKGGLAKKIYFSWVVNRTSRTECIMIRWIPMEVVLLRQLFVYVILFIFLFIYCLFNNAGSTSCCTLSNSRWISELVKLWKKIGRGLLLKYFPSLCLDVLRKSTEKRQEPVSKPKFEHGTSQLYKSVAPLDRNVCYKKC